MTADRQPTRRACQPAERRLAGGGPRTAAGKARSARNALTHGLRARGLVLLDDEDAAEFRAFARALPAELAPQGRLQADLVSRIAMAAWRARRSPPTSVVGAGSQARLEAGLLATCLASARSADPDPRAALGTELIRDSYGPRAFQPVVRYRGSVLAELFRSLAALKLLQAGTRQRSEPPRLAGASNRAATERTRETAAKHRLVALPQA